MQLELLAPAKNIQIGIAAIDCGADALYIAGPAFGARESAGNSMEDLEELVKYAHRFGVKVYMVVNTILYDNELPKALELINRAYETGFDAIIAQDTALLESELPPIPLFASTQMNIRTPERAKWLSSLGFERLILARELSVAQIRDIVSSSEAEVETFIHGALCVSYSGQCYLSQKLSGRSANRGCCIQACRAKYDLVDKDGNILVRDYPLLSLKDMNASSRLGDLIRAGVTSFKIEGRLKNESYIRNTVRYYRNLLDDFIDSNEGYERASYGRVTGGFVPDPEKTFSRGFTDFFLSGKRGDWLSGTMSNSKGEYLGTVTESRQLSKYETSIKVSLKDGVSSPVPGDGLCIIRKDGSFEGAGVNAYGGGRIVINAGCRIPSGSRVYRNFSKEFEKSLSSDLPKRLLDVGVRLLQTGSGYVFEAGCERGCKVSVSLESELGLRIEPAKDSAAAWKSIKRQMGKNSSVYLFHLDAAEVTEMPFIPVSGINGARRLLAEKLDGADYGQYVKKNPKALSCTGRRRSGTGCPAYFAGKDLDYRENVANKVARSFYLENGAASVSGCYEKNPVPGAELMRSKYCIRYQFGACLKSGGKGFGGYTGPLYLRNNGYSLKLEFDCANCEMVVTDRL